MITSTHIHVGPKFIPFLSYQAKTVQAKSIFKRPLDLLFVLYLCFAAVFSFLRVLGQITHIGSSVHSRTPYIYRIPSSVRPVVYLLNLLLLIVPQVMAWKFVYYPNYFANVVSNQESSTNGQLKKKQR
ncbi:Transmembrane 6 superfamily member 1 [Holothuria leucospilota]|uniref:Transmembrane 6 superfamily member 1 n=1 Tax=Holothuria leucospilota TaxID=206669 RepID=A0A9Q1BMR3_HOLLE|nr:Transmembrane 6 superfamily member 1 [Holothuria leucospilota]